MKYIKNIDIKICVGISIIGVTIMGYLWTFVTNGNHWQLFGAEFEQFLRKYDMSIALLFSVPLIIPLFF